MSIVPNDTVYVQAGLEDLQMPAIYQLNNTQDSVRIGWKKIYASVPAKWEAAVCDNKICYTALEDSGVMAAVAPAGSGFLSMHLTGHTDAGRAVIRYEVWDVMQPAERDTLTFIMDIFGAGVEPLNIFSNGIYPVPFHDKLFCLQGMEFISLENTLGQNIMRFSAGSMAADLSSIPAGAYLIRYRAGEKIRVSKIIKN